jgi:hypothetical protein
MIIKNKFQILFTILICIVCFNLANAQDTTSTNSKTKVVSLNKIKLYALGFGFEREQAITKLKTIYFGASIESVVPFFPKNLGESDVLKFEYSINVAPIFTAGFRNYYNLKRREKLSKAIENNSASFIGLEYNLITPILLNNRYTTRYVNSLSPIWGFQKSISKNSNLEFSAGPSLQTDFNNTRISGFARFGVNFLL